MKPILLVVGPLAVIIIVAVALFGTAGPADNDVRANAGFRLVGMLYGAYLVALGYSWWKRKQRGPVDVVRVLDPGVVFPLSVTFEDGSVNQYGSVRDLEMNLEDFDSALDASCSVSDHHGRPVRLRLKSLELQELSLIRKS